MSRTFQLTLVVALASMASLTFQGCAASSTSDSTTLVRGDAGAPADGSEAGSTEVGADAAGSTEQGGGPGLITTSPSDDGGSADIGEACAAEVTTAQIVPLDMYILLDTSTSMLSEISTNSTKWSTVKSAMKAFLRDKSSQGLGVGLQYFPIAKPNVPKTCMSDMECGEAGPCALPGLCWNAFGLALCFSNDDCGFFDGPCVIEAHCEKAPDLFCASKSCGKDSAGNDQGACTVKHTFPGLCSSPWECADDVYAKPALPISVLPGATAGLIASLDAQNPAGTTPTAPALRGALQEATEWAGAHPDHRVVAVIATDGLPTICSPTNIDEIGDIAADAVAARPSIKTFVIGVLTPADTSAGAKEQLDKIALGGGTEHALLVDTSKDVATQFVSALDSIRTDPLACEFQIPKAKSGKDLDYGHVNVSFKAGKVSTPLYYVGSVENCDTQTGGWYYDTDPTRHDPTTIFACPSNCTTFQATPGASVEIALGCETIVK